MANDSKLSSFLEDNSGELASTRLTLLLWSVGILVIWVYRAFHDSTLVIDNSVVTLFGIIVGGKAVQRFGEKPEATTQNTAPISLI